MFITFEGVEGVGKSTHTKLLKEYFQSIGKEVLLLREPGGTHLSEKIREILLNPKTGDISPVAELLLYESARAELMKTVLRPSLEEGKVVILDRFIDSTLAYQGYGRGISLKFIETLNKEVSRSIVPDITFLIDLPVEEGLKRALKNAESEGRTGPDRLEAESNDFHRKVRDGFLEIAKNNPKRVKVLDGKQEIAVIFKDICDNIDKIMNS